MSYYYSGTIKKTNKLIDICIDSVVVNCKYKQERN